MLENMHKHSKCSEKLTTGEYLPYNCTELNNALKEYAAKYLNETEEIKRKALQEIYSFAIHEAGVGEDMLNENLMLCYLRFTKFDVKRAILFIKRGRDFIKSYRHLFSCEETEVVKRAIESDILGPLPFRDAKGRAIVFGSATNWDPSVLKTKDLFYSTIVTFQAAVNNPLNQVAGYVVILDCKDLNFQHFLAGFDWAIFIIKALQRCCPCLVKEVHVVHTPAIVKNGWKLLKPFLKEKIKERVIFYKSNNWESLHRRIPPELLPEELGGHLGPFSSKYCIKEEDAALRKKELQTVLCFYDTMIAASK